jgi:hypothetical protein
MPAKSAKQERFMQAVANNPKFAKKVGVPVTVGQEFTKSGGGMAESKKMVKKEVDFMKKKGAPKSMVKHEMAEAGMKKGSMAKYAKGGMVAPSKMGSVRTAAPSKDGIAAKGKTKGKQIVMAGAKGMKKGGYC